jgi:hypothetical protein
MFIAEAISIAFKWAPITQEIGEVLRNEFFDGCFKVFHKHLWINYWETNNPALKSQLIKLTEFTGDWNKYIVWSGYNLFL